jgi:hypothetical protein
VAGPEMNKLHVQSLLQSAVARKTQAGGASIEKVPTVANPVVDLGPWTLANIVYRVPATDAEIVLGAGRDCSNLPHGVESLLANKIHMPLSAVTLIQ